MNRAMPLNHLRPVIDSRAHTHIIYVHMHTQHTHAHEQAYAHAQAHASRARARAHTHTHFETSDRLGARSPKRRTTLIQRAASLGGERARDRGTEGERYMGERSHMKQIMHDANAFACHAYTRLTYTTYICMFYMPYMCL